MGQSDGSIAKQTLEWNTQDRRKRGKLRTTWRKSIDQEPEPVNNIRGKVEELAKNEMRRRPYVSLRIKGYDNKLS